MFMTFNKIYDSTIKYFSTINVMDITLYLSYFNDHFSSAIRSSGKFKLEVNNQQLKTMALRQFYENNQKRKITAEEIFKFL